MDAQGAKRGSSKCQNENRNRVGHPVAWPVAELVNSLRPNTETVPSRQSAYLRAARRENTWSKASLDKVRARRIEFVIDQWLYFFDKSHRVRLFDVIVEGGLVDPARMDVKQPGVLDRPERVNAQTTGFLSCWSNDPEQCAFNFSFLTGTRVKTGEDEQFHGWFKLRLKDRQSPN